MVSSRTCALDFLVIKLTKVPIFKFYLPRLPGISFAYQAYQLHILVSFQGYNIRCSKICICRLFCFDKLPGWCLRFFGYQTYQSYRLQIFLTKVTRYIYCLPSLPSLPDTCRPYFNMLSSFIMVS